MGHRGFFIIRPFHNKTVFKLKGCFDNNNIQWLKKAIITSKSFHNKYLELDMKEVQNINIQTMSFLVSTLKDLNKSGVKTTIVGFDRNVLHRH